MKSKTKLILFFTIVFFYARFSYAQGSGIPSKADDFDNIKAEIAGLLEKNKKLEIEHSLLQQEYAHLQELIKLKQTAKKELGPNNTAYVGSKNYQNKRVDMPLKKKEDQLLIEQSRNNYLAKQSIDSEISSSLWMLKLSDLQYKKRALEMELELQSLKMQDNTSAGQKALQKMILETKHNQEKRKKIEEELKKLQESSKDFDTETRRLTRENNSIERKIKKLQKQLDIVKKENSILKKKLIYADRSFKLMYGDKGDERTSLEESVRDLEAEYKKLSEGINNTLSAQQKKREYMKEVVKIDKENVKLREQIASLKAKIKEIQQ